MDSTDFGRAAAPAPAPAPAGAQILEQARMEGGDVLFARDGGLERALRLGFFLVEAPKDLDLEPGLTLARHFNEPRGTHADGLDPYRGFREAGSFCFNRKNYQVEQLIIGRADRERLMPPDAFAVSERMSGMAVAVLRFLLRWYGVREELWDEVTGGAAHGRGTHWFVANRYDPGDGYLGCAPHTDTGFVTVLHADRPGLEIGLGGHWVPLACPPGFFVVNFGVALETLTRRKRVPSHAALHRVAPTVSAADGRPRVSVAAFASAPTHGALFEILPDGSAAAAHDVDGFLRAHDAGTWDEARLGPDQARSTESVSATTRMALERSRIGA